ncbi:MAG TPA: BTAD domain-containing putative transcriptional regulator [Gaiellaceae bacterium]|nr:BTAD domain-containing putative transcriptional regulator [Gaiellaceae bacterium]
MDFRILGPLEVISDGRALELGGAKQRTLLAMLVLHANTVVSVDRLIDALWEDDPPENAQKALHVHVSGLRKLVGRERLETAPGGYSLRVRDDELDLARFRRLHADGQVAEVLALWRGPPLSEFAYQRFARAETARLEDERLACLEKRIDRDLEAGRHAEVTGELEALVAQHPLRESLRHRLMLALYRSGRQAQALEAYQEARAVLVDELGIEPGRELRDLHQAILNQDPALDVEPSAPPEAKLGVGPPEPPEEPVRSRQVRKTVTALYVGIDATTEGGERLDPEARKRVNDRAFRAAQEAVARHGGTVDAVTDEGLAAIFGLPVLHDDDALRAVRAADETRRSLLEPSVELSRGARLEVRVGIGTGEVVTADTETGLRAVGEPLTAAARPARAAAHGEVLLDRATCRLAREAVTVEPVDSALRLLDVSRELLRPAARVDAPMVGRGRESRRLEQAFEQAVGDRSCQLFTVLGAAGVGKSRLVREFLAGVSDRALVARGRCLPYGEGITYWPLLEAVKEAVGLDDSASSDEAQAILAESLSAVGADAHAHPLAELIGLAEATGGADAGPAAAQALFEALAERRPLVLVFDDIHWAEPTFLDLIEYLADWLRQVPVLLICLARPELLEVRPGWAGGKLNATSILLEALSDGESGELVEKLAGSALTEEARRRIVEASEGNPLFVEEMLALTREGGDLVVPPTIQALLAARLDRLGDAERAVLDVAAVQGKVFNEDAVTALLAPPLSAQASGALASVVQKELIRPDRPILGRRTYRFRHLLIRDAAYDSIPKESRADLHERFARWLESAAGDRAAEYEEIVGYHLEQAHRYRVELGSLDDGAAALAREAAEHLAAAGRRAFVRSDAPAGVNLSSRAAALLAPDDPLRVELIPNVRVVQGLGGDMSWAERVLTEAVEAAATSGDRRVAAQALVQRALLRLFSGAGATPDELIQTGERAASAFTELGDEVGLARSWRLVGQAHYLARNAASSAEAAERALVHARRARDAFEERETIQWLAVVLFLGPKPAKEAAAVCTRLLEEVAGQPALEVYVLGPLSYLLAIQGRRREAEELASRADELMQELGEGWVFPAVAGYEALWVHDPPAAERKLLPGYEALKRVGERSHFCTLASLLARIAYSQGDYERAGFLTREAEEAAAENDVHCQIHWRATRAKVLAREGRLDDAEQLGREAVAFAATSDFLCSHGDALVDLGEVLTTAGRPGEAIGLLHEAIELYEQKGNVLAAGAARERLVERDVR